jgi:uncharacterized protein YdeI (YjbR/CyaY-like superfamily)
MPAARSTKSPTKSPTKNSTKNPEVDAFIKQAAPFAKPILTRVRRLIHKAAPGCREVIKWGMPAFDYHGPFVSISAFKAHCVVAFWKAPLLEDPAGVLEKRDRTAMGHLGRIASKDDLPDDATLLSLFRQAAALNEAGITVKRVVKKKPARAVPPTMLAAIRRNPAAKATWEGFSPSHQREYIEWITEAKKDATRERRMSRMIEQLADGKSRHWRYQ